MFQQPTYTNQNKHPLPTKVPTCLSAVSLTLGGVGAVLIAWVIYDALSSLSARLGQLMP